MRIDSVVRLARAAAHAHTRRGVRAGTATDCIEQTPTSPTERLIHRCHLRRGHRLCYHRWCLCRSRSRRAPRCLRLRARLTCLKLWGSLAQTLATQRSLRTKNLVHQQPPRSNSLHSKVTLSRRSRSRKELCRKPINVSRNFERSTTTVRDRRRPGSASSSSSSATATPRSMSSAELGSHPCKAIPRRSLQKRGNGRVGSPLKHGVKLVVKVPRPGVSLNPAATPSHPAASRGDGR